MEPECTRATCAPARTLRLTEVHAVPEDRTSGGLFLDLVQKPPEPLEQLRTRLRERVGRSRRRIGRRVPPDQTGMLEGVQRLGQRRCARFDQCFLDLVIPSRAAGVNCIEHRERVAPTNYAEQVFHGAVTHRGIHLARYDAPAWRDVFLSDPLAAHWESYYSPRLLVLVTSPP